MNSETKSVVKYGSVPLKNNQPEKMHYIHPLMFRDNPNWVKDWLPNYFDKNSSKVKNSNVLYGPPGSSSSKT